MTPKSESPNLIFGVFESTRYLPGVRGKLDIIAWLGVMHSLNGILLTEASLDPSREAELMYIYDAQSRHLSNLEQEFDAWLGGPMVYPLYDR